MKSTLIEQSPVLVQAIHEVFHQSESCHCRGPGKLSEDEVLEALVRLHYVAVPDVQKEDLLPIEAVARSEDIIWGISYDLKGEGVRFLTQLEAWTFADLLRLSNIGHVKAAKIEAVMAKYGLALKDGEPARYQHLLEDESATGRPVADLPPDEIREHCTRELISVGQRLVQHSAALMKYGLRANNRKRVGAPLKKTLNTGVEAYRELMTTAQLLHDLEQRESTIRRLRGRGPRVPAEARQQGNVITGAFVPPADPSDAWAHGRHI